MKAALYARVSSEEQVEGYSLDAQKRAFHALVEGRNWDSYREYYEEGKSARTEDINKRPVFKEIIADALSAKFDVLVVHKLDHFWRNLRDVPPLRIQPFKLEVTGIIAPGAGGR
jgi:site-specific DNA recombinase